MADAISVWIHIVAVAIWLGPQFFLFLAAMPAVHKIEDRQLRLRVMRVITGRFGWMAWTAMGVVILSGIGNTFVVRDDFPDAFETEFRWAWIFQIKMVLVLLTIAFTAAHTFFIGPWQMRLQEQMNADPSQVTRLRKLSMALAGLGLLTTIGAIYAATVLANHEFSFQET